MGCCGMAAELCCALCCASDARAFAEGADNVEADDEEQPAAPELELESKELAMREYAVPGEDEGAAAEEGFGGDQAPQNMGLSAHAAQQQQDAQVQHLGPAQDEVAPSHGREGPRRKRVALLAPKTAWASQQTRCCSPFPSRGTRVRCLALARPSVARSVSLPAQCCCVWWK